jgi:segregation and condensation protein B
MELKRVIEALVFSSPKPMSPADLRDILKTAANEVEEDTAQALRKVRSEVITQSLEELASEVETLDRAYRLVCVAGEWQFIARPDFSPWLRVLFGVKNRPGRLSQPALETLSIIAYRQPVTRAEVEQIRGVSVDGVMQTLLERDMVQVTGKAETPGRPSLYGTTLTFLQYFGLRQLEDLPAADELRRIPIEKPSGLPTVDPDLATAPPEALAQADVPMSLPLSEDTPQEAQEPADTAAGPEQPDAPTAEPPARP